jgi:gamma-glutamyl hercynylcysteine S-oxide synthase
VVDRYLDDLEQRYGGIDSVLIWSTYPNMGIDNRNQLDMVRSMPGGVAGVKQMVADFHRRGVRVLFPMMMWDQGTREPGSAWQDAIAALMKEIGADGINGDTQDGVPLEFSLAADRAGHPMAFEPEGGPSDEALAWNLMTWGQYGGQFEFVPGVDRYRWLEPKHTVHISDRWNRSKTDDLQYAFFNGEGWEAWENIWGIWNGITPRDAEATRRVATLERGVAGFLISPEWEPFYPMHWYGVFASRWPAGDETVWTIVNRNEYETSGRQMTVPHRDGVRYFDLYHGSELNPQRESAGDVLSFPLEAHGYGAVLATHGELSDSQRKLMAGMKVMTAQPLASYSNAWKTLPQTLVDVRPTPPAASAPEGMIRIPAGNFLFKVEGIEIEGSNDAGVDVQYPWEPDARRFHEHQMTIRSFYIDKYPVKNAQFKKFLDASHYRPKDDLNFLRDWKNDTFPEGWGSKPVTWVSHEDARAYAAWAGKRLPREWEWQYAAQGSGRAPLSVGQRLAAGGGACTADRTNDGWSRQCRFPPGRSQSRSVSWIWSATSGNGPTNTCRCTHPRRDPARRQLLSAAGIHLVFSAGLPQRPAWQAAADGAQLRPFRCARVPLRRRRPIALATLARGGRRVIEVAEHVVRGLLFAAVAQQAFAIVVILDTGQETARAAEVHQYPGSHACKEWNPLQHGDLVAIDVGLVLLGPRGIFVAVSAEGRFAAKLAHHHGLVVDGLEAMLSALVGMPSYQPMYSLQPITSRYCPSGSSIVMVVGSE